MKPRKILYAFAAAVLALFGCGNMVASQGGGGSEVEIIGKIYESNGTPASGVVVRAFPQGYDPLSQGALPVRLTATTNMYGTYVFERVDTGTYNILARRSSEGTAALITGVPVRGDICIAPPDTLEKTGAIKAALPDSLDRASGYLYIPGTGIAVSLNSPGGFAMLDSIPAGLIPAIVYAVRSSPVNRVLRYAVPVVGGDTTFLFLLDWQYARRLVLNTAASGAAVSGSVADFPILIRLTKSVFDFSRARGKGEDVRFTKPDGTALPGETERWDSAGGQAEIWVKVDTVYGNDSTHSIVMYWGNPAALSTADPVAVFDTAGGFQGVYHLAEPQGRPAKDATANRFDGTPSDTAPAPAAGAIGLCQQFDGSSNCFRLAGTASSVLDFPENGHYTVSAWVYMETLVDTMTQVIVAKGNEDYFLKMYFGPAGDGPRWEFAEFQEITGHWINRVTPITENAWKQLTGVRDGNRQYLYIDGVLVNTAPFVGKTDTSEHRYTGNDVYIGRYPEYVVRNFQNYCYWHGMLDEVQIADVARSVDWIRLSFMNQRVDDKLVVFK